MLFRSNFGLVGQGNFLSPGLMSDLYAAVEEINRSRNEDEPSLEIFLADQVIPPMPGSTGRSTRARFQKVNGSLEEGKHSDEKDQEDSDDSLDVPLAYVCSEYFRITLMRIILLLA